MKIMQIGRIVKCCTSVTSLELTHLCPFNLDMGFMKQVRYSLVGYGMVEMANNALFWTNGPFLVIFWLVVFWLVLGHIV